MKVFVDIDGLKRKIADCHKKAEAEGYEEDVQFWLGKSAAYLDILCGYLGVTGDVKQWELTEKILEEYGGE